ncbi:hypothetical protein P8935_04260 [Telmatobacter sp. DSM 110680]|uniref:Transaldolase n=1 Tax=Telmatobacter sp. DSM 110680 TaxID=3036704 RepID=A0AAU7DND7_9BACT
MTAVQTLLAGLFDYAGLYPPASLSLQAAANNYLEYRRGQHSSALGRFILNMDRLDEFRSVAGDSMKDFKLSVIASEDADWASLSAQLRSGLPIDAVEVKCGDAHRIERISNEIPRGLETYFEVPMGACARPALMAIRAAGARAKLRMGGVVPAAIPSVIDVVETLKTLAELRIPFKATAGLHHPFRSTQPLTYQPQCPTAVTHGFMNLYGASTLSHFGASIDETVLMLAEEVSSTWSVGEDSMSWRDRSWTTEQIAMVRQTFFISIGSCSFEEPIRDLQSLGWL